MGELFSPIQPSIHDAELFCWRGALASPSTWRSTRETSVDRRDRGSFKAFRRPASCLRSLLNCRSSFVSRRVPVRTDAPLVIRGSKCVSGWARVSAKVLFCEMWCVEILKLFPTNPKKTRMKDRIRSGPRTAGRFALQIIIDILLCRPTHNIPCHVYHVL